MGLLDLIKGEFIDVIEWTDDSRDTLSYRFPDQDKAIKNGAQLIVRESQVAQFMYLGQFGDTFQPGKHTLTTDNIPILTKLKSWSYGFNSPFKADVFYIVTRLFTGNKWGTANPIMARDADFGVVRLRAFGTFDFKIVNPQLFLKEVAGSDQHFRLDEFADTMRSRMVSVFSEALASSHVPVIDVATRYSELGEALLPVINPVVGAKYGLAITSFIVENVSVPAEVEAAIDKRSSMTAIGNLNDYVKYQLAQGMVTGGGGAGGTAAELAVGFGIAQQMIQQGALNPGSAGGAGLGAAAATPAAAAAVPDLLAPADVAKRLGVPEADVMTIIESGELKAKKIGASYRISKAALDAYPGAVSDAPVQIAAQEKHPCPACGAQAEWSPAKQKLVCPFCGTESPYVVPKDTGTIAEIDLLATLNELPEEERGWNTERRSVQCQSCQAIMVFDPAKVGQNCEFCGSPALVAYEEIKSPIRPRSLLPFKISQDQVRDRITGWYASKWFAPGALKHKALVDQIKGLYIPYWTFDAQVHCRWQAEAGYYYYVSEEYRDNEGHAQVRQVRQVRWEPAAGELDHFFDDEPVPGTKGVDLGLLRGVEPFPTKDLVPYDTAFLSGFVVERYQVVLADAARLSHDQMNQHLMTLCGQQVPGDTFRSLHIDPDYSRQTFKHTLVPVWLLSYTFGPRTFQVIANGATGAIAGHYPKSAWKIAFAVIVVLLLVILAISLSQQ